MSTPANTDAFDNAIQQAPVDGLTSMNAGDILKLSSGQPVPVTGATDVPHGISQDTNPVTSLLDKLSSISVRRRGVVFLYLKTGDTAKYGDSLYLEGSDPQVVTTSSGGGASKVGICREQSIAGTLGAASNATRVLVELAVDVNN